MTVPRKWRLLFVSAPFSGIDVFCRNIQRVVDNHDEIDASWIWIEYQPKELISRIPPLSSNWTLKGGLVARSRVKMLESAGKQFDAVFFNHTIPAMFVSKFRRRVPMVLSLDVTPQVLAPYNRWYCGSEAKTTGVITAMKNYFIRAVYRDAVYILAWSNLVRESLIQDYGTDPDKVKVIPPGIDVKQWAVYSDKRPNQGKEHQLVKILFVGGEFLRKGGDILLRIAQREDFRECEFHFVTKSFEGVCGKNVYVYKDIQPNSEQLQKLYRGADIFALPTRADISPNAVCEAFAFQLPVVSTTVGGINEMVIHDENGFLVPPDNEEAFARQLSMLVHSPDTRMRFGQAGRQAVDNKYDINKNAEKVLEYLLKAASGIQNRADG